MRGSIISILVIENHPIMREALRTALAEEPDLNVVGVATDGNEALALVGKLRPDVILVNLPMPGMDSQEAIARLFKTAPQSRILVVSSLEDEGTVMAAIHAGALGYFPKTAPRTSLLDAVRKVADGVPYLPPGITMKLFQGLRKVKTGSLKGVYQEPLTTRHKEILDLLGKGHSDQEIAVMLGLDEATIRVHVRNLLQRLGLETRAQAVAYIKKHQGG
jgi:DNA-binding NarL/FixJ family response regulator